MRTWKIMANGRTHEAMYPKHVNHAGIMKTEGIWFMEGTKVTITDDCGHAIIFIKERSRRI